MNKVISVCVLFSAITVLPMTAFANKELQEVPANQVCMVNDRYFATEQIPVKVAEKTYYGCCAMCKATLNKDPSVRSAIDPVSKKSIDKATAVIGALPNGSVLYFETEDNLRKFEGN